MFRIHERETGLVHVRGAGVAENNGFKIVQTHNENNVYPADCINDIANADLAYAANKSIF